MPRPTSPAGTFTVLLVCTGNICRSALAERLGRAYLDDALGNDAPAIRLMSAGTQAVVGSAIHADTALVLAGLGGDSGGFVAQQLVDGAVMQADLVLTMTREHRGEVLALSPRALARTFTLREAADLMRLLGDDGELPGEHFLDRARALVKQMATVRSRRDSGAADDIPDPIGQPLDVHQEVGDAIADALLPLLTRIAALTSAGSAATHHAG